MKASFTTVTGIIASAVLMAGVAGAASAASVADFYQGKTIKLIIGTGVGGSYDLHGRLVGRHIARHIPGNPKLVVQNMPGAGSRKAAGYIYNVAPQDGTVLANILNTIPLLQALGKAGKKFDAAKFHWIGNLTNTVAVVAVWHNVPVKTVNDARKTSVIIGATSPGSLSTTIPLVLNNVLGTKFRIVTGYKSGRSIDRALEQGEVQARAGASWRVWKRSYPHWIQGNKLVILAQIGSQRDPTISKVPLLSELGRNAEETKLLKLFSSPMTVGKPTVVAPNVPKARVKALRKAYSDTMGDPKFLADAKRQGLLVSPISGTALQKLVEDTVRAPGALIAKAKKAIVRKNVTSRKKGKKKKK